MSMLNEVWVIRKQHLEDFNRTRLPGDYRWHGTYGPLLDDNSPTKSDIKDAKDSGRVASAILLFRNGYKGNLLGQL